MQWSDRIKLWFRRRIPFRSGRRQRVGSGRRLYLLFRWRRNGVGGDLFFRRNVVGPTVLCRVLFSWLSVGMLRCRGRYRKRWRPTSWRRQQRRRWRSSKRLFNVSIFFFSFSFSFPCTWMKFLMSQREVGTGRFQWNRVSADARGLRSIRFGRGHHQGRSFHLWTERRTMVAIIRRRCRSFVGWIRRMASRRRISLSRVDLDREESAAIGKRFWHWRRATATKIFQCCRVRSQCHMCSHLFREEIADWTLLYHVLTILEMKCNHCISWKTILLLQKIVVSNTLMMKL